MTNDTGILFIVCGPSGVGKTTLSDHLLDHFSHLTLSVSYTTREPRGGEKDGVHYHFVDVEEFAAMRQRGAFAEWAQVHGNLYGTSVEAITSAWRIGHDVLFDIDYQGAEQLRERFPEQTIATLVAPPSMEALEERLRGRETDSEEDIARRLRNARDELARYELFDYVVFNDDLDSARDAIATIYEASRHRRFLLEGVVRGIVGVDP